MMPATRLALQGPSQELPESKDSVAPCLGGAGEPLGLHAPPPMHSSVPAGGCRSTYFPKGLIGCEPLAAASQGPRWGANIPSTTAQQLVPGQPGRGASCPGAWGRAGPSAFGAPGPPRGPAGVRAPAIVHGCVSVRVSVHGVCASIVGKRGRGHFAFCEIIS